MFAQQKGRAQIFANSTQQSGEAGQQVRLEGYGPGGVAMLIDCVTVDPGRSSAAVREILESHGGRLGATGSVAYLFNPVGIFIYPPGSAGSAVTDAAHAAGAEDVVANDDGSLEVLTDPLEFAQVRALLESTGLMPAYAELTQRAAITVELDVEAVAPMLQLLEALAELDYVRSVYSNAEIPREILASL
jgi:transcriptional/translational regulatory protein YebC/TACO1